MTEKIETRVYISFDDSSRNPTYAGMDGALLVLGPSESDHNPCGDDEMIEKHDLIPTTPGGLRFFARAFGFDVGVDNDGQMILYTGITE